MAITKIFKIGGPDIADGARHLARASKYIMNPAKTADGIWVGGNCGNTAEECYFSMMQTKEDWDKTDGRQGYHIVLSFPPGEGNEATVYEVAKEFCEEYLGNGYEYVFSVHNDQPHLHAHIVFNSVNRLTGVKYHYEKAERIGRTYAEHLANEEGRPTWEKIIKGDIDFAVTRSKDLTDFKECMTAMGYELKTGHSEKHGDYITYIAPGEGDARHRSKRDYRMGEGYTLGDIARRLESPKKEQPTKGHRTDDMLVSRPGRTLSRFQVMATYRLQRLDDFHFLDLDLQEQVRVREDLLKIDKLREEVDMILARDIQSKDDCVKEMDRIKAEIRKLNKDDPNIRELRKDKNILRRILNGFKEYEEMREDPLRTPDGNIPMEENYPSEEDTYSEELVDPEELNNDLVDVGPVLKGGVIRKENYDG